ncbi:hypothetical protein [Actinomadura rayongensis]|uniref:Uncharacterized protein n=1 Tax=Actinomadura rayongensis TaxID=1429076 RepID=A0A6I4WG94_9ACTN|nr:hypothetical protein [Actinomadura rayongensis]MXQ66826.1 hypothetical protein [Actinomadura rayongensis]
MGYPIALPSGHRRYPAEEIHRLLQTGDPTADAPDPEPEPSPRARAVLHSVIRTYVGGDATAAIKALRTDLN